MILIDFVCIYHMPLSHVLFKCQRVGTKHCLILPFAKAGFSVVDLPSRGSRAQWDRLLLPCIGPEVLRFKVPDARKAVPW